LAQAVLQCKCQVTALFHTPPKKMTDKWEPKVRKPTWQKVESVDPNAKRRNLIVKVVEVKDIEDKAFKEVVVGDESGVITCRFLEDQLAFAKVGKSLRLQNARIAMFQGHIRVECDKWSKLADHEEQTFTVNTKNDVSATEFELVAHN